MKKILTLLFCLISVFGWSATYYVDYVSGNDANSGLTEALAWQRCPGDANYSGGGSLSSGDTVYFERGVTYSGKIITQSANVIYTILSMWGAGNAIIDGAGQDSCFTVNHSTITISGTSLNALELISSNVNYAAIWNYNASANLNGSTFTHLIIHDVGDGTSVEGIGIKIGGNAYAYINYEISYCTIYNCYSAAIKISGSGTDTIDIHNNEIYNSGDKAGEDTQVNISSNAGAGVQNITFHNNVVRNSAGNANGINLNNANNDIYSNQIYSNGGRGISLNPNYNTNYTGDILVYKNDIYSNGSQGIIISTASQTRYVKIYNNKIYNNTDYEINLSDVTTYTEIYNNSFYSSAGHGIRCQVNTTNTSIKNNIISLVNGYTIYDSTGSITEDYNYCYRNTGSNVIVWNGNLYSNIATYRTASSQGSNSVWTDPLYVDPPTNMHLQLTSLAIDDGDDLSSEGYSDDKDNVSRPQGTDWDVGTYEYPVVIDLNRKQNFAVLFSQIYLPYSLFLLNIYLLIVLLRAYRKIKYLKNEIMFYKDKDNLSAMNEVNKYLE